jgi:hypothetical protein
VYLSESPGVASLYSKLVQGESGANVMPVYVQVKNPYEFDRVMPFKNQEEANEFSKRLKDAGYDSTIRRGPDNEITELVMFEPEKIKSATGNRGTYDLTDPDINKAKGGLLHMADAGRVGRGLINVYKEAKQLAQAEREANKTKFLEPSKVKERLYHATPKATPKAPQDDAFKVAQQRAALPVEKGGLGLPANNTPQQRAKAMGFDIDAYHATDADILAFDNSKLGVETKSIFKIV